MPEEIGASFHPEAIENTNPASRVADRVQQRITVLEKWSQDGIPQDRLGTLPKSLREAARWSDISSGIEPIPSPNDFVKTHITWGSKVATVERLLNELNERYRLPHQKKSARSEATKERAEVAKLMVLLRRVTSQWHSARAAAVKASEDAAYNRALAEDLKGELAQRDEELSEARRAMRSLEVLPRLQRP